MSDALSTATPAPESFLIDLAGNGLSGDGLSGNGLSGNGLSGNGLLSEESLSEGLSSVMPSVSFDSADRIFGTGANDLLQGTAANNIFFSGGGDDAVSVGAGNNIIYMSDARSRGRFERDYLNLGSGRDSVVLGDDRGSYYTADGWQDSVYIEGFEVGEDRLLLHGDRTLYTLENSDSGTWLLWGDSRETAIAFLKNVQDLDRLESSLSFLEPAKPVSEIAPAESSEAPAVDEASVDSIAQSLNFYLQLGVPEFQEVTGGIGDDLLIGSEEADQLIGFGGRDYAFGGAGTDLFVLGDFNGAYYARSGWEDSAYIDDFTAGEDQLQLHGSASDYSTEATETGLWLYANGDAIAFFKGIGFLDFSAVQYRNSTAM